MKANSLAGAGSCGACRRRGRGIYTPAGAASGGSEGASSFLPARWCELGTKSRFAFLKLESTFFLLSIVSSSSTCREALRERTSSTEKKYKELTHSRNMLNASPGNLSRIVLSEFGTMVINFEQKNSGCTFLEDQLLVIASPAALSSHSRHHQIVETPLTQSKILDTTDERIQTINSEFRQQVRPGPAQSCLHPHQKRHDISYPSFAVSSRYQLPRNVT